jgi:hypothetical protein
VVYGNPGMLSNAFRVDGDNATPATGGAAWTFASGSNTTRSLVAKRFGASQTVKVFEVQREDDTISFFSVGLDGTVEWQTDTADANGVTVGAMDWRDVNSLAVDKRVAQILGKLNGATANNRGGELDILLKADAASGLATVATFGTSVGLTAYSNRGGSGGGSGVFGITVGGTGVQGDATGNGVGIAGAAFGSGAAVVGQALGTGVGVLGQALAPGSGPGVKGEGNGSSAGVSGTGGTTGAGVSGTGGATSGAAVQGTIGGGTDAFAGNGNLNLSTQSTPASSTGIAAGVYNKRTNCRAWAYFLVTSGSAFLHGGQNIASVAVVGMDVVVTFTDGFLGTPPVYAPYMYDTGNLGAPVVSTLFLANNSLTFSGFQLNGSQINYGATNGEFVLLVFGD